MGDSSFDELFGRSAEVTADAPGRVNLIGEHTDYSGGYVLPLAIPQRTRVALAARHDGRVRAWSAPFAADGVREYPIGEEQRTGTWLDYVQGMTAALSRSRSLAGFDLWIASAIPGGSGLSSSAALLVAVGRALRARFGLRVDDVELAVTARRAENDFVGAPVGIMDQMACSLGDSGTALFLDTRTLGFERVPLPPGAALVVIDSGVGHKHAGGEYAVRRRECADAARLLGVPELRDVEESGAGRLAQLPPPLDRRARHVLSENARVVRAVTALRRGDLPGLGRLLSASHASLRDDFEVSIPAIDQLVQLAGQADGVHGARLTGGGFGGSIVALVDASAAVTAAESIARAYAAATGRRPKILMPNP